VSGRKLGVVVDGAPMPEEEARTFWRRFSDWMEDHKGDLAGFAETEGLASVHPEMHDGMPVLIASKTAPQRAYANAPSRKSPASSGSPNHQRRADPHRVPPHRPTRKR
jgi:hypothetical protein